MIILSWAPPLPSSADNAIALQHATTSATLAAAASSSAEPTSDPQATHTSNPLEGLFKNATVLPQISRHDRLTSVAHSHFIRRLFASSPVDVGVFIDSNNGEGNVGSHVHILVPFFGGPDDRLALEFAVQLCARDEVTASVIRMVKDTSVAQEASSSETGKGTNDENSDAEEARPGRSEKEPQQHTATGLTIHGTVHSMNRFPDTIYPNVTTQTRLASDTADNICWFKYAPQEAENAVPPAHTPIIQSALQRVTFSTMTSATPLKQLTQTSVGLAGGRRLIVVAGRGKRLAAESHQDEMQTLLAGGQTGHSALGNEMRKTLGDVSTAFLISGPSAELMVVQASAAVDRQGA